MQDLEAGIFRQLQDKPFIIKEVVDRVIQEQSKTSSIDNLILNTSYSEIQRLENARKSPEEKEELSRWKKTYKSMLYLSDADKGKKLEEIVSTYVNDIVGNFDPKVYRFATNLVPSLMSIFFRTVGPKSVVFPLPSAKDIDNIIILSGEIEALRKLSRIGTIILVPTHLSNMDSIVMGWSLYRLGLPPFTYGAGKNLFTNPVLSYFMHNLGAYKVDRRIRNSLYKDILKMYSTVVLERNYHSLFFPGGTRSRSGGIESKLKLGLLGTGISAYINNLKNNKPHPDIFVVPCTINYHIALEAETLIDDYLKEIGKARYIIEDDESSSYAKVLKFLSKTSKLDASLNIRFGQAFDLFGNIVDENGKSYDSYGRLVDAKRYVMSNGEIVHSEQRDNEYTKELGEKILKEYYKDNVLLSTNILAFTLFSLLKKDYPNMDLYRIVRLTPEEATIDIERVYKTLEKVKNQIIILYQNNKVHIDANLINKDASFIIKEAMHAFNTYYEKDLINEKNGVFILDDIKTVFYYHNKLKGYDLEKLI